MRPLQSIAMGLVIVALRATFQGYDALPDPLGWLLVLHGAARLPADLVRRDTIRGLAVLALLVSIPLWLPDLADRLYELHPSLGWVANLPQLAFAAVLADSLARRAAAPGPHRDTRATAWLRVSMTGFLLAAALPVVVFGGGVRSLELPSYVLATLVMLMLIWLLFSYNNRPWARAPEPRVDWTGP